MVKYQENVGLYTYSPMDLISLIVAAIQEQKKTIIKQQKQIDELITRIEALENK